MGEVTEAEGMRAELNPSHHGPQLQADAPRQEYEVVAESGLFKNGRQIDKGQRVTLDAHTAANFMAAGDIKEVDSD